MHEARANPVHLTCASGTDSIALLPTTPSFTHAQCARKPTAWKSMVVLRIFMSFIGSKQWTSIFINLMLWIWRTVSNSIKVAGEFSSAIFWVGDFLMRRFSLFFQFLRKNTHPQWMFSLVNFSSTSLRLSLPPSGSWHTLRKAIQSQITYRITNIVNHGDTLWCQC